jgi:hypothetical protein
MSQTDLSDLSITSLDDDVQVVPVEQPIEQLVEQSQPVEQPVEQPIEQLVEQPVVEQQLTVFEPRRLSKNEIVMEILNVLRKIKELEPNFRLACFKVDELDEKSLQNKLEIVVCEVRA